MTVIVLCEQERAVLRQMALHGKVDSVTDEGVLQCSPCIWSDDPVSCEIVFPLETLDSVHRVLTEVPVYGACRASGPREIDNGLDGNGEEREIALRCLAVVTPGSCGGGIA